MPEKGKIVIFDAELEPSVGTYRPIETRGGRAADLFNKIFLKPNEVSVDRLSENVTTFLSELQDILAKGAAVHGDFMIDTVEVDAKITGEGQIGLMGSHVNMSGSTGIRFIFKRITKHEVP